MLPMARAWKCGLAAVVALAFLAVVSGCSTFRESPGHSPFSPGRNAAKSEKKFSLNPLSMFKREEPKLAESPDEFVGLPRPEW